MTSLPASSSEDRPENGRLRIQPDLEIRVNMPAVNMPAVTEPAAENTRVEKVPAKKAPAEKAPAEKAPAEKAPAEKAPAKKAPAKKVPVKKTAAKPTATKSDAKPVENASAETTSAESTPTATKPAAKRPAVKRPASKNAAAKTATTTASRRKPTSTRSRSQKTQPVLKQAKVVVSVAGLVKRFGGTKAVDGIDLIVREGSFYGIVGPNGAGKTTTLSMITGMLRPDAGTITVHDIDVWAHPTLAKRGMGILPDQLRLFDRLTGAQMLHYAGSLRGLETKVIRARTADLVNALGLNDALQRLVADYSAGMTKKIALAAAMIHAPRLLVLDEPFESVDPVSAANVVGILKTYVARGGTVLLSSHGMELIERMCDNVAIVVEGKVLASGDLDAVRDGRSLEERFIELAGGRSATEDAEWLHSFSD